MMAQSQHSEDTQDRKAVSPPDWGGTVERMKDHDEISNPWALSWWMKGKGFKPHYKERKKESAADCMLDEIVDMVCEPIITAAKKRKTVVKKRSRGTCVFQSTHPKVKDNKDHFPINDLAHASNALARVEQYDSVPSWYDGTLGGLKSAVKRAVYEKFPGLRSRKRKRANIQKIAYKAIKDLLSAHRTRIYFDDGSGRIGVYNDKGAVLWYERTNGGYSLMGETDTPEGAQQRSIVV